MQIDVYEIAVVIFGIVTPLILLAAFLMLWAKQGHLAMSQTPAATTAVRDTDIASESAMSFAHSQIDTVQSQSAPCRTALSMHLGRAARDWRA
jgi:hypothetical protein